jgi:predicted ribosomally synthesized peptide with SipW-like signal peptide
MKSSIKRKPVILAGALALALVMVAATTFAWFSAKDSVENKLATAEGLANVRIQEVFVETNNWMPGQTITKEVAVLNAGSAPALVRVSFGELLTVSQPASGETTVFDASKEAAGKRPQTIDRSIFGAEWFEVTTEANTAKGGVKLAADYSPAKVYARHDATTGSYDSYSFAVWAPIAGSAYAGQLQDIRYDRTWNNDTKTLALSNIRYMTYQGSLTEQADWTVGTDRALTGGDIGNSIAETKLNTLPAYAAVNGKYPNYIQLNYGNIAPSPTAGKWYFNAADGYFYYIGRVEAGTVTPNLLGSLLLEEDADSDYYSNMTFKLLVNMEAIQDTRDAVASEWPGVTGSLKSAIDALCES